MTRKQRRVTILATAMTVLIAAIGLVLVALQDTIVFFYSPSDLAQQEVSPNQTIRLGGLVEEGSVDRIDDGIVQFRVTDLVDSVPVSYQGILPDLFREGQGVVAEGSLDGDGRFVANKVLAKHDENYMPAEVADALKKSGQWQGQASMPAADGQD